MSEWIRKAVAEAGQSLSTERGLRIERAIEARHERAKVLRRQMVTIGGALAVAGAVVLGTVSLRPGAETVALPTSPATRTVKLDHDAQVTLLDAASLLETRTVTENKVLVALDAGRARFDVGHRPSRTFTVQAGAVTIQVLGTTFVIEQRAGRSSVAVERGSLSVSWPGGSRTLQAGDVGTFPPERAEIVPAAEPAPSPPSDVPATPPKPATAWRQLARKGAFGEAYEALRGSHEPVRDEPGDLLLAADVARFSDHPRHAAKVLRRVYERFPRDPRAALAAFTEARLRLEQLNEPALAADAFARARALDPSGQLAEDALAREVEAWSKAGDVTRTREAARRYLDRYPQGRRASAVERLGRLQP